MLKLSVYKGCRKSGKRKLENKDIYEKFIEEFGKENFELLLLKYKETIEYIISFYQNSDTDFDLF